MASNTEYGLDFDLGEEIDMLRSRMIYAQQMKSKLIAEILGETNATN